MRIANDSTPLQRRDNKYLRERCIIIKVNGGDQCYVKANRLSIENKGYSIEDLQLLEENSNPNLPNVAPNTPTMTKDLCQKVVEQDKPVLATINKLPELRKWTSKQTKIPDLWKAQEIKPIQVGHLFLETN